MIERAFHTEIVSYPHIPIKGTSYTIMQSMRTKKECNVKMYYHGHHTNKEKSLKLLTFKLNSYTQSALISCCEYHTLSFSVFAEVDFCSLAVNNPPAKPITAKNIFAMI